MFEITKVGPPPGMPRLIAPATLKPADFAKITAALGTKAFRAVKTGFVTARIAQHREYIETRWNGMETEATAEPGDAIVTNVSPERQILRDGEGHANTYVIRKDKFPSLYEPDGTTCELGAIFRSKVSVKALYFSGGFELMAPWGEMQTASDGYLIQNGDELYGNNKTTFDATYQRQK